MSSPSLDKFDMISTNEWNKYFEDVGVRADYRRKYIRYVRRLEENHLPVIFDIQHLCFLFGRSRQYMASVINATDAHYREFKIPKRTGGWRTIVSPYPALQECQSWIFQNILKDLPVHNAAQGYVKGRSIISNATVHAKSDVLLKVDLKDFFPSIGKGRIIGLFMSMGYAQNVAVYLASLCTLNGCLPQGAPTSPVLSNLICRRLDSRLAAFAKSKKLKYTRYADDICVSGREIQNGDLLMVRKICVDEGFVINERKFKLVTSRRKVVTGIGVDSGRLYVPRAYKRKVRLDAHMVMKHGLYSHVAKKKIADPQFLMRLMGRLSYWKQVEPESKFPTEALIELGEMKRGLVELQSRGRGE